MSRSIDQIKIPGIKFFVRPADICLSMKEFAGSTCLGNECNGRNLLIRSESADLNRLTAMVGRVFNVPVAYAAMLGHRDRVMCRFGSGSTYWKDLKTLPLAAYLASPRVIQEIPADLPEGANLGDLRFAATAPINTLCGRHLGVLVIADRVARPEFCAQDLGTLVEMSSIIAHRIEMQIIAAQGLESNLRYGEAEQRFRNLANLTQTLIACNDAAGYWDFVNDAWLEFTKGCRPNEPDDGWQLMHPRHRARVLNAYLGALQLPKLFTIEAPLLRHDGIYRWMKGNAIPRFLRDGALVGFTLCLTDVADYHDEAPAPEATAPEAMERCPVEAETHSAA
jgi:PAS domain-containing protein